MNMNDDEMKNDNPFDESFYVIPEEVEEESLMTEQSDEAEDEIVIDLEGISDKEEFYSVIRDTIEIPDYFGNNLDALYDVLTEDFEEKTIVIKGIEQTADEMKDYMKKFRRLCDDVAEENEAIRFVFE